MRSILGRFLEHSRIFYFQNGGDEEFYIGSADMMQRNLDRRVEALAKVKSPELKQQLKLMLELALRRTTSRPGPQRRRQLDAQRRRATSHALELSGAADARAA